MFTSPKTEDAAVQRAIDDITERVNELNARGNALARQGGPRCAWRGPEGYAGFSPANGRGYTNMDGYPLPDPAVYIPPQVSVGYHPSRDKENVLEDPVVLPSEQRQGYGGLGLGWVGRELGNTIGVDASTKGREKEKKARREWMPCAYDRLL
jgi:hypothetical protein